MFFEIVLKNLKIIEINSIFERDRNVVLVLTGRVGKRTI